MTTSELPKWEQKLLLQSRARSDARNWEQRLADAYGENEMYNETRISQEELKSLMISDEERSEAITQECEYSGVDNDPIQDC